jgi:hypothetical protein
MARDFAMLPESTVLDIARMCGNGWMRKHERIPVSSTLFWQRSRIENYAVALQLAAVHVPAGHGMTRDRKDAIWRHVCAEVDLMLQPMRK